MFEEIPDSQIQTQTPSVVSLTPSQDAEIQMRTPWARLFSCVSYLHPVDLIEPSLKLGRSEECDIVITSSNFPPNRFANISKVHFEITKEYGFPAYITDRSKNGTYINGNLVGKNNRNILQNDDIIAIGYKNLKAYIFKHMASENDNYLPEELRRKYAVSSLLGRGACGEVRMVFHKVTCKTYAVKKIIKAKYVSPSKFVINDPVKIHTEIEILKSLNHPFIMGVQEIVETDEAVFLVLDYMEGGELTSRILSIRPMSESLVKFLFYQIVLAVQYLHSNNITHRDLKPENVLLSSENDDAFVKVSDFGLSKIIHDDTVMRTVCGTPNYVAPEVLDGHYEEYNKQVDIWSLGVILFYMLSQELPFKADDRKQLAIKIVNGDYRMNSDCWLKVSEDAQDLIRKMLNVNPRRRITIDGILAHPWIFQDHYMKNKVHQILRKNNTEIQSKKRELSSDTYYETCTDWPSGAIKRIKI